MGDRPRAVKVSPINYNKKKRDQIWRDNTFYLKNFT